MTDTTVAGRALALYEARRTRRPIAPFTDATPQMTPADGYAISQALTGLLTSDGDRVIGYKAGLTSEPMQRLLGVAQPDYGPLLGSAAYADGAAISLADFIAPKLEAEIAFVLGAELRGPGVTVTQARAAIAGMVAALEIVDSRIEGWRIKIGDTIADLASGGAVVLSGRTVPPDGVDTRLIGMVLTRHGEVAETAAGAAALGDPVAVLAWLANTLGAAGATLAPGQVIMTGALHAAVPMAAGDVFRADFDLLGPVTARITE